VGSLQREVLALLPLLGSIVLFLGAGAAGGRRRARYAAAGLLVGAAATVKPQLLLALPAFVAADVLAPLASAAP